MAKKSLSAQHFLECDNCEENPSKFLCKTCPGHLCEHCKNDHEKKKMTRNHEIVSLSSNNEEMLDMLYCSNHAKKKLECYCNRCGEPVCTECIIQSHNGHSVESLSTVYKCITDYAKEQKDIINTVLLPKFIKLLSHETAKESALTSRAEGIKKKIETYTQTLVEMIIAISAHTVEDLSKNEKEGLREIQHTKINLVEQINELQVMSEAISEDIEAQPNISFFKLVERNDLERFETTLPNIEYSLSDFQPGIIRKAIQENFGIRPILKRSRHINYVSCSFNEPFCGLSIIH